MSPLDVHTTGGGKVIQCHTHNGRKPLVKAVEGNKRNGVAVVINRTQEPGEVYDVSFNRLNHGELGELVYGPTRVGSNGQPKTVAYTKKETDPETGEEKEETIAVVTFKERSR